MSWINTAFPFAAAYLMTTHTVDLTFVLGTLFFLVPYNLAMYGINDVFDYESDMRNPRKGGVEGAVLDRRFHRVTLWAVVITNVPFLIYLVAVGSPLSWLVLTISMFAVVAYSAKGLRFKEIPFLDSITSSTHFVSPAVYGAVLAGAVFTPARCKTSPPTEKAGCIPSRRILAPRPPRASPWPATRSPVY